LSFDESDVTVLDVTVLDVAEFDVTEFDVTEFDVTGFHAAEFTVKVSAPGHATAPGIKAPAAVVEQPGIGRVCTGARRPNAGPNRRFRVC